MAECVDLIKSKCVHHERPELQCTAIYVDALHIYLDRPCWTSVDYTIMHYQNKCIAYNELLFGFISQSDQSSDTCSK